MIQQTDFEKETGLPRFGCMFMSIVVAAWRTAENRDPRIDEVMRVHTDCIMELVPTWENGKPAGDRPILEMVDPVTHMIYINDPSAVLRKALSYCSNGWRGKQWPDLDTVAPQYQPRDYKLAYTLLNFRRPSADGHWVLGDRSGMNVLYNPDESLDINWWGRSGAWRGLQVWRV